MSPRIISSFHSVCNFFVEYFNTNSIFSHHFGDNVSCSRSFLYLSPIKLSSPSLFNPKSTQSFPNPASWLSSAFNTPHFNHFTTTNHINTSSLVTPSSLLFHPKFKTFVQHKPGVIPTIFSSIVDPGHLMPEPLIFLVVIFLMDGLVSLLKILTISHMFVLPTPLKFYDCTDYLV